MKLGVPLLTYFILNKNISNIENKAILATKYKALKNFAENPLEPQKDEDKKSLPEFLKTVYQDMKEYDKFAQNELPKLKEKLDIKKRIPYSKQQLAQAKSLQKNFSMAINVQREELYNKSLGIKALSETILGPLDIIATALGGKIGHSLSKKISNKKIAGIMTGLGAVIAFIPAAIVEAKLTKQQKLSEKIAAFSAIKELDDYKQFLKNLCNLKYIIIIFRYTIRPSCAWFLKVLSDEDFLFWFLLRLLIVVSIDILSDVHHILFADTYHK